MDVEDDAFYVDMVDDVDINVRKRKIYIRDALDPIEFYTQEEFKRRYRFSKDSVINVILPKIVHGLEKYSNRGLPVPPLTQLLVCLRYFATGSYQIVCGDLSSISQSSVSRIIFKVASLLAALIGDVIKFPLTVESQAENQHLFRDLGATDNAVGLPAIDGAIDCTHVRLTHTNFRQFQEVYRNRKGWFSLNVQAVVGPNMEFLDIVPEWAGSTHDSRIIQNSRLYVRYQERHLRGALVGDAGYPCLPFLFTPVANPMRDAEQMYNFVHARTRGIVERTFGIWKRRFPCLSKGIATKLVSSTTIVVACAVLHNISLIVNDVLPEEDYVDDGDVDDVVEPFVNRPGEGLAVRQALIERLYM